MIARGDKTVLVSCVGAVAPDRDTATWYGLWRVPDGPGRIATVSDMIVGVWVGGAISATTAVLVWLLQSISARKSAADQRSFDRQENRLRDRLDAYAAFATVMAKLVTSEELYETYHHGIAREDDASPADREPPVFFPEAEEALTRLEILVPALHPAGRSYLDEFYAAWYPEGFGRRATRQELERTRSAFLAAARTDLGLG